MKPWKSKFPESKKLSLKVLIQNIETTKRQIEHYRSLIEKYPSFERLIKANEDVLEDLKKEANIHQ